MKRTRSSARASDSSIAVAVDVQEVVRSSVPSKRIRGGGGVTAAAAEGGGAPRRAAAVTSQSTPAPTTPRTTNNEEVQIAIPAGAQSNLRNTTFSAPSAGHVSNPSARGHTALARALQDAEYTFSSKGIAAFRDVMNKMPLRKGLSDSNSRAVYWITWLRAELSAGQWEHIEDVIQRATEAVPSEGRSRRSKEPRHRPDSDSEASVLEAALLSIRRAAGELRTKQEEEVHELLETSISSPIMTSGPGEVAISRTLEAMAGRPCTNEGPRSITLPAPRALDAAFGKQTAWAARKEAKTSTSHISRAKR